MTLLSGLTLLPVIVYLISVMDWGKMISVSKETAFNWLWGTTLINLGLGAVIWIYNFLALESDERQSMSYVANALAWQTVGSGLWGFGVLVFVITLATSAVVGAIDSNSIKPLKQSNASARRPKPQKTVVDWLKE
jgi:hypothetical protein